MTNLIELSSQELSTPIGTMIAVAANDKLCLLEFTDRKKLDQQIAHLCRALNAEIKSVSNPILKQTQKQLDQYFTRKRQSFSLPVLLTGTDFQRSVWQVLQQIPYGLSYYYQQQAELINRANSVRAVANANASNKISIIIPCHRVIGKNGRLTGYASGVWRKQILLNLEGNDSFRL